MAAVPVIDVGVVVAAAAAVASSGSTRRSRRSSRSDSSGNCRYRKIDDVLLFCPAYNSNMKLATTYATREISQGQLLTILSVMAGSIRRCSKHEAQRDTE